MYLWTVCIYVCMYTNACMYISKCMYMCMYEYQVRSIVSRSRALWTRRELNHRPTEWQGLFLEPYFIKIHKYIHTYIHTWCRLKSDWKIFFDCTSNFDFGWGPPVPACEKYELNYTCKYVCVYVGMYLYVCIVCVCMCIYFICMYVFSIYVFSISKCV